MPGEPAPDESAWAEGQLLPGEVELWRRMSGADRRHAVGVARRVADDLGSAADRPVLAAALLHDVGKVEAAIGPWRRAVATVGARWLRTRGGRLGRYLRHDTIGAGLLRQAGSDPLTSTWALEHHLPPDRWTIAPRVGHALKAADDD